MEPEDVPAGESLAGATLRQRGVGRSQKAQAAGGEAREDGSQLPRPQVARRLREDFAHVVHHAQVTAVLALVGARSRPGSGDAPAVDRSAEQKSGAAAPVIGTAAAVHGDGATELGDGHHEKVRSTGFEALKERSQTRPEVLGGASEAPLFGALTHVCVPALGICRRRDKSKIGAGQARNRCEPLAEGCAGESVRFGERSGAVSRKGTYRLEGLAPGRSEAGAGIRAGALGVELCQSTLGCRGVGGEDEILDVLEGQRAWVARQAPRALC